LARERPAYERPRLGAAWRFALLAASLAGCRELPDIASGVCGNGVVDGREDCDGFAPEAGERCRPAGSVGECRLDCRTGADGVNGRCPDGWGCDLGGLCRAPTGDFESPQRLGLETADSLDAADFDGDKRSDLVSREPVDTSLRGRATVHYFDKQGAIDESRVFPKRVTEPYLGDISGDGRADLVFSTFLIGVLLGREDRNWVPETFSSYRIAGAHLRMVGAVPQGYVTGDTGIVALTTLRGEIGIFVPDNATGTLSVRAPLPRPVEELAGEPATANVIEARSSPCLELVLAYERASYFSLFDLCDEEPTSGLPLWKQVVSERRIELVPPAEIDHGPLLADLNGDGHIDALVGAAGGVYAAYGDGTGLGKAEPFLLHSANELNLDPHIEMPLAVGEFSGDHAPDFVFPFFLLGSTSGAGAGPGSPAYWGTSSDHSDAWTEAAIDDLNGDGRADVVAASGTGLDLSFFTGTNSPFLNPASVATSGPVEHLAVGDFDGDSIKDVVFVERAASSSAADSLAIAFGAARSPPEEPVTVAHVRNAEQVASYADGGHFSVTVASSQDDDGVTTAELTLLDGSPDRLPIAVHTLVNFSNDGSVDGAAAIGIAVGAFTHPGAHDVFAVSASDDGTYGLWVIPSIDDTDSVPIRLSATLPSGVAPIVQGSDGFGRVALALEAADLDGDGRDEVMGVVASESAAGCALIWGEVVAPAWEQRGALRLDGRCDRQTLRALDVDQDGSLDVVVLASNVARDDGTLRVLFNDGAGGLSLDASVPVPLDSGAPRAFAWLPPSVDRSPTLAVVTESELALVPWSGRDFGAPVPLLTLERGTGVAAGDFDGDRVVDLAVADAGDVRLLKGGLVPP